MTAVDPPQITLKIPLTIRPAQRDDLAKLEWFGQYAHFRQLIRRAFYEQVRGRRLLLIADFNGFPVGQVILQFESTSREIADGWSRAYLYSFRVLELFRGLGIGSYLLREAESLLVSRGFQFVTLSVARENGRALRLYLRTGYSIVREDPGEWRYMDQYGQIHEVVEPCYIMQKQLN